MKGKEKKDKLDVVGALQAQLALPNGSARKAGISLGWKNGGGFERYQNLPGYDGYAIKKLRCALAIKRILRNNAAVFFDEAMAMAKASMAGSKDE